MAMRFTETKKWTDHWFHRLTPISKLFFMYLCENVDVAGIWEIDHERAAFDIGVTAEQIETALRETEKCYISDGKFLWLKNFIKYQGNLPLNENVNAHKGIIKRINENSMRGRILQELKKNEQLSLWQGFTRASMEGSSNSNSNSKGLSNSKKESSRKIVDTKFEQFWQAYPRKVAKGKAEKSFAKINPSDGLLQKMLSAIEQQNNSEQWNRERPKYIPYPATWLNGKRWEDELLMKETQNATDNAQGNNKPFVR